MTIDRSVTVLTVSGFTAQSRDLLRWLVSVAANFDWAACSLPSATNSCTNTHGLIKDVKSKYKNLDITEVGPV